MFIFNFKNLLESRRAKVDVGRDADELLQLWGSAAFAQASDLSRREDWGLLPSSAPGHWWRVRKEIARRIGQDIAEPAAEFAA